MSIAHSSRRRKRRTKADMVSLCDDLFEIVEANRPCTCRQVFYRAVSAGVIPKTETAYKSIVCRLLAKMRRGGHMDYSALADNTRWQRKPNTHGSLESALWATAEYYRRDLWDDQDVYCEIWTEKDAMAGVLAADRITRHIDQDRLDRLRAVEEAERDTLLRFTGLDADTLSEIADEWGLK